MIFKSVKKNYSALIKQPWFKVYNISETPISQRCEVHERCLLNFIAS